MICHQVRRTMMRGVLGNSSRSLILTPAALTTITPRFATMSSSDETAVQEKARSEKSGYWKKNQQLNRPVSPHLAVYSWQVTNSLSIIHRVTGVALYGGVAVLAVPYILQPYMFPAYIAALKATGVGAIIMGSGKFLITWPLIYHAQNGVRHLFWDAGYGFNMGTLTNSGIAVVVASFVVSFYLAFLL